MPKMVSIDFEGVEVGGTSAKVPEGDYAFKITKVQQKKARESGNPLLLFTLRTTSGPKGGVGKDLLHNCTLTKNSLWNLRNLLEATGKTVPSKAIKIDLEKLVGLTLAGTVIDDEYNGKKKSTISAFFPVADLNSEGPKNNSDDSDDSDDSEDVSGDETSTEDADSSDEAEELFD